MQGVTRGDNGRGNGRGWAWMGMDGRGWAWMGMDGRGHDQGVFAACLNWNQGSLQVPYEILAGQCPTCVKRPHTSTAPSWPRPKMPSCSSTCLPAQIAPILPFLLMLRPSSAATATSATSGGSSSGSSTKGSASRNGGGSGSAMSRSPAATEWARAVLICQTAWGELLDRQGAVLVSHAKATAKAFAQHPEALRVLMLLTASAVVAVHEVAAGREHTAHQARRPATDAKSRGHVAAAPALGCAAGRRAVGRPCRVHALPRAHLHAAVCELLSGGGVCASRCC